MHCMWTSSCILHLKRRTSHELRTSAVALGSGFGEIAKQVLMFSENLHGRQEFYTTTGRTKYQLRSENHTKWRGGNDY